MISEKPPSYREAITLANKDIHARCDAEIDLLWDDGKAHIGGSIHKIKVWNDLGSLDYLIDHRNLVERGAAYREFLEDLSAAVNRKLSLRP